MLLGRTLDEYFTLYKTFTATPTGLKTIIQQTHTNCEGIRFYDCYNNIMESVKDNGILTNGYVGGKMEIKLKNQMENAVTEGFG